MLFFSVAFCKSVLHCILRLKYFEAQNSAQFAAGVWCGVFLQRLFVFGSAFFIACFCDVLKGQNSAQFSAGLLSDMFRRRLSLLFVCFLFCIVQAQNRILQNISDVQRLRSIWQAWKLYSIAVSGF